jgi:bifunctional non-homologous end joining protein LigD
VTTSRFIKPCSPILAKALPAGADWTHEVKFDGYRVQVHKDGEEVAIFSRNGHDLTARFLPIAITLAEPPAKSAVLDGELVASDAAGRPDFGALHRRRVAGSDMMLWLFDLLVLNARDLRELQLHKRQARLRALVRDLDCPAVLASESFDDGEALMRSAEKYGPEGVVSKRRESLHRSGPCKDWRKIKTTAWREANKERRRLFGEGRLDDRARRGNAPSGDGS